MSSIFSHFPNALFYGRPRHIRTQFQRVRRDQCGIFNAVHGLPRLASCSAGCQTDFRHQDPPHRRQILSSACCGDARIAATSTVLAITESPFMRLTAQEPPQFCGFARIPSHRAGHRFVPKPPDLAFTVTGWRRFHARGAPPAVGKDRNQMAVTEIGTSDKSPCRRCVCRKVQRFAGGGQKLLHLITPTRGFDAAPGIGFPKASLKGFLNPPQRIRPSLIRILFRVVLRLCDFTMLRQIVIRATCPSLARRSRPEPPIRIFQRIQRTGASVSWPAMERCGNGSPACSAVPSLDSV